ncbi:MAG: ABC transporter substrate-binding protein [Dehalococcoidia bacterium]|nr:ABC transporter substrate-binding protein [Dehalococcoidia bacterium]MDH5781788.1 ABC transporter substrate-binding protein [Dehalococcoidia bacterium]
MDEPTKCGAENMPTKGKTIGLILALIIIIGVTGVVVWQQFYKPEGAVAGSITVVDDVGRNVTITGYPPERIVSLAPSCTEILFALGLGNKVVGVDEYSDYPPEVKERVEAGNLTTVGAFADISTELVVGLEPDLILATGGVQVVVVESLEGLGQPVVVLYPERFDGVLADISLVGEATGQIEEAEAIVADMQKRAQEIADKTQGASIPRVYIECFFNGGYWTFGSESYAGEAISMAGGVNVFSGFAGGHISMSTEVVLDANPEIIIICKGYMATACGLTPETFKERPAWSEIYAVQNDQIYEIDEPLIVLGGPRLVKGVEELAKLIHPELFS